jgi:hypothetical protein
MHRALIWFVLLAACATTHGALTENAGECESFAEFNARFRSESDELTATVPGEELMRKTSAMNSARRACARHTVETLVDRRESKGVGAVQAELNALTEVYGADEVRSMLGDEAVQLSAQVEEARQRAVTKAAMKPADQRDGEEFKKLVVEAPEKMGDGPSMPTTMCAEANACTQVDCIIGDASASDEKVKPEFVRAAQRCLDSLSEPAALEKLRAKLEPWEPNGASTEIRSKLESAWRAVQPDVDQALTSGKTGLAAQLSSAFIIVPIARKTVTRARDEAKARALARAEVTKLVPEAAWLHLKLAESFGAEEAPQLAGAGRWDSARWRCETKPEFPALPAGLDVKLNLKCEVPPPAPKDDSLRTFEMRTMKLTGTFTYACAGKSFDKPLRIEDPGNEKFPTEMVQRELIARVDEAKAECSKAHRFVQIADCADLSRFGAGDIIKKFVGHARFTHAWEPCFAEWFLATEGARLPPAP